MTSTTQHKISLDLRLDDKEILQSLGYPVGTPIPREMRDMLENLVFEIVGQCQPRALYTVCSVEQVGDDRVTLCGHAPINGPASPFLKPADKVVVYALTAGDTADQLLHTDPDHQRVSQAIASAIVEAATESLIDHLQFEVLEPDQTLSAPFNPGFCGLSENVRRAIFSIIQPGKIGIALQDDLALKPTTSGTGLIGIGPHQKFEQHGVPCQHCHNSQCHLNREFH